MNERRIPYLAFALLLGSALATALLFLGDSPTSAQHTTLYVAPAGDCGGAHPCHASLQDAIDAASDGDTIKVAGGVYTTTGLAVTYISKAITLTGGYSPTDWDHSLPAIQPTVIDAEHAPHRRGAIINGAGVTTITLQALTIQGGQAQDSSAGGGGIWVVTGTVLLEDSQVLDNAAQGMGEGVDGGGIYLGGGKLILRRVLFEDNTGKGSGGAFYVRRYGSLAAKECTFRHNDGGGVYASETSVELERNTFENHQDSAVSLSHVNGLLSQNTFRNNTAWEGGGLDVHLSHLSLVGNSFVDNSANGSGGGIYAAGLLGVLHGNTFRGNSARDEGGGIRVSGWSKGTTVLTSNLFTGNAAGNRGGGLYIGTSSPTGYPGDVTLRDNRILSNTAGSGGALAIAHDRVTGINDVIAGNESAVEGIYLYGDGSLSAYHWTLVDNGSYALRTDGASATLTNTLVASHTVGGFSGFDVKADHTLFHNSGTPCSLGAICTNSIAGDPDFVDATGADYHIGPDSAAIDQGLVAGVTADIDQQPRPYNLPDLGADEYWPPGALQRLYLPLVLFHTAAGRQGTALDSH